MRRRIAHLVSVLRDDRGVQLAELAIVLPIFLLLFGATAEFGRYFYEYSTLAKASRVGARYLSTASVTTADDTAAKNIV
ncbi:MAG TPA: TadE family protein, partial [Pyrinomonadaceae bacterium]|nr:TadE family protein [Pyrinomonadaceae bacterium]